MKYAPLVIFLFCVHRADMQIIIFSFGICTLEALIPQSKCSKSCQLSKIRRPGFKYQFKSQIISQMSTSNTKKLHVRSKSVRIYTPYSFVGNVLVIFSRLKSTEQCCLLCNSFQFFIIHKNQALEFNDSSKMCIFSLSKSLVTRIYESKNHWQLALSFICLCCPRLKLFLDSSQISCSCLVEDTTNFRILQILTFLIMKNCSLNSYPKLMGLMVCGLNFQACKIYIFKLVIFLAFHFCIMNLFIKYIYTKIISFSVLIILGVLYLPSWVFFFLNVMKNSAILQSTTWYL